MTEPASRFVSVDGARVHYRQYNPDATHERGLMLVHGMWAHSRWWDHIAPEFTDRYRVAAIDLSGMGDSDRRSSYSMRGFAEGVLAAIEDSGMASATIVGHSFGGNVSAHACHLRPDSVTRAVLIDTHLFIPGEKPPTPDALHQSRIKIRIYDRREEAVERYRLIPKGGDVEPALLEHVARTGLRQDADGWRWKFDETIDPLLSEDPGRTIPSNVDTPIDLIYGARSTVVSPKMVEAGQEYFRNCGEPVKILASDHHVLLEQPDALVAALRGLFARPVSRNDGFGIGGRA